MHIAARVLGPWSFIQKAQKLKKGPDARRFFDACYLQVGVNVAFLSV